MYIYQVVCRQLGFTNFVCYKKNAFYGEGQGPIMLDNVQCVGNESVITDCIHNGWYDHNCFHHEDAGFICGKYMQINRRCRTRVGNK